MPRSLFRVPMHRDLVWVYLCVLTQGGVATGALNGAVQRADWQSWQEKVLSVPYFISEPTEAPILRVVRQDYEQLERNRSVIKTPLILGQREFKHGLGTHSLSQIQVVSPDPITRFTAWIGVDLNDRTRANPGSVDFSVSSGAQELFHSGILRPDQEPVRGRVAPGPGGEPVPGAGSRRGRGRWLTQRGEVSHCWPGSG